MQLIVPPSLFNRYFNGEYYLGRKPDDKTKGTFSDSTAKHNFHE